MTLSHRMSVSHRMSTVHYPLSTLMQAGQFVQVIEERQGLKIGCIEEIAFQMKFIDEEQLRKIAQPLLKLDMGSICLA